MNIETTQIQITKTQNNTTTSQQQDGQVEFKEEFKTLQDKITSEEKNLEVNYNPCSDSEDPTKKNNFIPTNKISKENNIEDATKNLNTLIEKIHHSDDNKSEIIQEEPLSADNTDMINKDFEIKEKDILPQMSLNMNFGGDGQPFSSFMNNSEKNNNPNPSISAKDLAEEAAILSTMEENIAIANKNTLISTKNLETKDLKVNLDSIIMNKADVEVFAELIMNKDANINSILANATEKSLKASKTLTDMLAKAMKDNQPIRIDFDNNISVIIKISKDGKISAEFLPSSQVAEAYLREQLPLLRQKFDENNIDYESLNQRERREQQKEKQQQKKGRNNE